MCVQQYAVLPIATIVRRLVRCLPCLLNVLLLLLGASLIEKIDGNREKEGNRLHC